MSQSKSPAFQNAGLRAIGSAWEYGVLRVDAAGCEAAIDEVRQGRRVGVNVTAPHKEVAARAVDTLSPLASRLGAVNCVRAVDGRAVGDNTDVAGIVASLRFMGAGGGEAVIFGAGGAAAAAVVACEEAGLRPRLVCRTPAKGAAMVARVASGPCPVVAWDAADVGEAAVCINATSIGLEGSDRGSWDRFGLAARRCALLDLRYGPVAGAFLMAAAGDVLAIDGATMLLHQGVAAFEQWTGVAAPVPVMRDALAAALNRDAAAIG